MSIIIGNGVSIFNKVLSTFDFFQLMDYLSPICVLNLNISKQIAFKHFV